MPNKHKLNLTALLFLVLFCSCRKFVEVPAPKTQLVSDIIFTNDQTATAAIVAIYEQAMLSNSYLQYGCTVNVGLSSDELNYFSNYAPQVELAGDAVTPSNANTTALWTQLYQYIYQANSIITGLQNSTGVSATLKKQLAGEAKFIRAYCHFYLVNLFGPVPYVTTTDYTVNKAVTRASIDTVYKDIIADLSDAQQLLAADYSVSNGERIRPNSFAATAVLARVYLYQGNWAQAETLATTVINNTSLYSLVPDLNNVFLKNSKEAIWQLQPVLPGNNTADGGYMIPNGSNPPASGADLSDQLVNAFDSGDLRKTNWVGSTVIAGITYNYPYKYKIRSGSVVTEYYMMLRLAEQYLIRAEARAQQNNLSGAIADLDLIRTRAGLPALPTTMAQTDVLAAVMHERRFELFCELGHRWLDLKRTNTADAVLGPIKSGWSSTDALYPIPLTQMLNDPSMTQNDGY